ncbi:DNA cytosine methyltransferase [Rhodopseudomonas sp. BR0G17]|uniref:DNA cytosine methyltransferase n=1 Tax=Rhodopseudomonas sp. BR0G17 TaxID=2269368 RepID=UPI0013E07A92|nr:DNA cytosine methyltransferase [Rhodopseudomonas sp. BR0G17]NEW97170.1 DNA cytosine methyltransferase [Rhodopseudomonas sp. BR0G17]
MKKPAHDIEAADIAAVDLFCGAAGLSLGLTRSGVKVVAGIDLDPACRFPFEQNIAADFLQADISTLEAKAVDDLFGNAKIRVLAGCAPCQPFSGLTTKRRGTDERWELLLHFLRIAKETGPHVITVENVPRLSHLPLWGSFVEGLEQEGYHIAWEVLDASRYGVPQSRRRLVLLASKLGPIHLPEPTVRKLRTVQDAIGTLPVIAAGLPNSADPLHTSRALTMRNLARIRNSQPAGTWRDWPKRMRVACHKADTGRTYPSVYGRMSWDKPSPTITTQFYGFGNGRFGHPVQDRAITLREGAILQSFPPSFKFVPDGRRINFREIGRLIGNAVPPALAEAIGQAIVRHVAEAASDSSVASSRYSSESR